MRAYYRLFAVLLAVIAMLFAAVNLILKRTSAEQEDHAYRVEISRLTRRIGAGEAQPDLTGCDYVTAVRAYDGSEKFFFFS